MKHEAMIAGLQFKSESILWSLKWSESPVSAETDFPRSWWLLEYLPFRQRTYKGERSMSWCKSPHELCVRSTQIASIGCFIANGAV